MNSTPVLQAVRGKINVLRRSKCWRRGGSLAEVQWEESQIPPAALAELCGWWFCLVVKVKTVVHKAAVNPGAGPAGACWVFRLI